MPSLLFCPAQRGEDREDEVMLPQLVFWGVCCCCFLNKYSGRGEHSSQSRAAPLGPAVLSINQRACALFVCGFLMLTLPHYSISQPSGCKDRTEKTLRDIPPSFVPRDSGAWTFRRSQWLQIRTKLTWSCSCSSIQQLLIASANLCVEPQRGFTSGYALLTLET